MPLQPSTQRLNCCPTRATIYAYAMGELEDDQSLAIEQHLLNCPDCETVLESIDEPSDAIIQSLAALPVNEDDEREFQLLQEELREPPLESVSFSLSSSFNLEATSVDSVSPLPYHLGNYLLESCIGRGASGAVYRAMHVNLHRPVAVKLLNGARFDNPLAVARFAQEMKALGRMSHRNVVRATDAGVIDGHHYLAMEFIEGIDAARLLFRMGKLRIADACEIVRQAAEGLAFIHDQGLIHRDVKPSNLLVTVEGEVKLLDLGIATHATGISGDGSASHVPAGTLHYMSPEQWQRPDRSDARSDIFSLGCTLFKLLCDDFPWPEKNPRLRIDHPSQNLGELRPELPRAIDRLVETMISPEAEDRPSSASEVAEALVPWCREADLTSLISQCMPAAKKLPRGERASRSWRLPSRRTILASAAAGLAAALWLPERWRNSPKTIRGEQRLLEPVSPRILRALGSADNVKLSLPSDNIVEIESDEWALVHLGRPVLGKFTFATDLLQPNWQGMSGLFFHAHISGDEDTPILHFQTLELRPPDKEVSDPEVRRLVWAACEIVGAKPPLKFVRKPLGEVTITLAKHKQSLLLELGTQGMPEVHWNDLPLADTAWKLGKEGRQMQTSAPQNFAKAFRGRLGLINAHGRTRFVRPQLTYLT